MLGLENDTSNTIGHRLVQIRQEWKLTPFTINLHQQLFAGNAATCQHVRESSDRNPYRRSVVALEHRVSTNIRTGKIQIEAAALVGDSFCHRKYMVDPIYLEMLLQMLKVVGMWLDRDDWRIRPELFTAKSKQPDVSPYINDRIEGAALQKLWCFIAIGHEDLVEQKNAPEFPNKYYFAILEFQRDRFQ